MNLHSLPLLYARLQWDDSTSPTFVDVGRPDNDMCSLACPRRPVDESNCCDTVSAYNASPVYVLLNAARLRRHYPGISLTQPVS